MPPKRLSKTQYSVSATSSSGKTKTSSSQKQNISVATHESIIRRESPNLSTRKSPYRNQHLVAESDWLSVNVPLKADFVADTVMSNINDKKDPHYAASPPPVTSINISPRERVDTPTQLGAGGLTLAPTQKLELQNLVNSQIQEIRDYHRSLGTSPRAPITAVPANQFSHIEHILQSVATIECVSMPEDMSELTTLPERDTTSESVGPGGHFPAAGGTAYPAGAASAGLLRVNPMKYKHEVGTVLEEMSDNELAAYLDEVMRITHKRGIATNLNNSVNGSSFGNIHTNSAVTPPLPPAISPPAFSSDPQSQQQQQQQQQQQSNASMASTIMSRRLRSKSTGSDPTLNIASTSSNHAAGSTSANKHSKLSTSHQGAVAAAAPSTMTSPIAKGASGASKLTSSMSKINLNSGRTLLNSSTSKSASTSSNAPISVLLHNTASSGSGSNAAGTKKKKDISQEIWHRMTSSSSSTMGNTELDEDPELVFPAAAGGAANVSMSSPTVVSNSVAQQPHPQQQQHLGKPPSPTLASSSSSHRPATPVNLTGAASNHYISNSSSTSFPTTPNNPSATRGSSNYSPSVLVNGRIHPCDKMFDHRLTPNGSASSSISVGANTNSILQILSPVPFDMMQTSQTAATASSLPSPQQIHSRTKSGSSSSTKPSLVPPSTKSTGATASDLLLSEDSAAVHSVSEAKNSLSPINIAYTNSLFLNAFHPSTSSRTTALNYVRPHCTKIVPETFFNDVNSVHSNDGDRMTTTGSTGTSRSAATAAAGGATTTATAGSSNLFSSNSSVGSSSTHSTSLLSLGVGTSPHSAFALASSSGSSSVVSNSKNVSSSVTAHTSAAAGHGHVGTKQSLKVQQTTAAAVKTEK